MPPSAPRQIGLFSNIGKRSVLVVAVEMIGRLLALRKSLKRGSVDEENVEPAVVVVIEQGDAAPRGLDDVFLLGLSARHVPRSQTCFGRDILKLDLRRRSVELDVGLRLGGPFGHSHSLTEHLNGYLPTYDNEQKKTDSPTEAIHKQF